MSAIAGRARRHLWLLGAVLSGLLVLVFAGLSARPVTAGGPGLAPPLARVTIAAPASTPVPAAASAPAPAQSTSSGPSGGQLFLAAILVAIGVAGATFMLRLLRAMPRRPPPGR